MRKILSIMVVCLCCMHQVAVAQDMRSLFLNAPDDIFPLLTTNGRADCVDYAEAGMKASVTNRLGGASVLEKLTGDYMYLASSAGSWSEAKLLPGNEDTVVCLIKGIRAEAADSRLAFYDLEWNRICADSMFMEPCIDDFFLSADSAALYSGMCDIYLVRYSLSQSEHMLEAEYTMPEYMNEDDAAKLRPLLRTVQYMWNGKRFVRRE